MSPTAESGSGRPWGVVTGGGGLLATLCGSIWELAAQLGLRELPAAHRGVL